MTRGATGRICGPCRACMAERDALKAEVERLRQTCDIRGANWERDAAELDQARARVAELEAIPTINFYTAQKDERIATLEAALRKYGRHRRVLAEFGGGDSLRFSADQPCPATQQRADGSPGPCTCGLDAALSRPVSGKGGER